MLLSHDPAKSKSGDICQISAVASPEQGGTIEGAGFVPTGMTATVIATANPGYRFLYWEENGASVSSDASYKSIISTDRNLIAMFIQE